jgi:hypothetical protein
MKTPTADQMVNLCRQALYVWVTLVSAIILLSRFWLPFYYN